jgi:hypothetical protein
MQSLVQYGREIHVALFRQGLSVCLVATDTPLESAEMTTLQGEVSDE